MISSAGPVVRLRRRLLAPLHDLRTAVWTWRELRRLRTEIEAHGAQARVSRPPRRISARSGTVLLRTARLGHANCLELSLLRQAWLTDRGRPLDVVIGVRHDAEFEAHAWIEGDSDAVDYHELHRLPPRHPRPLAS